MTAVAEPRRAQCEWVHFDVVRQWYDDPLAYERAGSETAARRSRRPGLLVLASSGAGTLVDATARYTSRIGEVGRGKSISETQLTLRAQVTRALTRAGLEPWRRDALGQWRVLQRRAGVAAARRAGATIDLTTDDAGSSSAAAAARRAGGQATIDLTMEDARGGGVAARDIARRARANDAETATAAEVAEGALPCG